MVSKAAATATTDAKATIESGAANPQRSSSGGPTSEIERVRFELLRSALYHDMRQTALSRVHKFMLFLTVVLGSSAIAAFGAAFPMGGQIAGAAVAVVSAAQLVWDFGGSARDHGDLRRRFYGLLSEAQGAADVADLNKRMTLIYADEPPLVGRVNRKAHNQAGESLFGDNFTRV